MAVIHGESCIEIDASTRRPRCTLAVNNRSCSGRGSVDAIGAKGCEDNILTFDVQRSSNGSLLIATANAGTSHRDSGFACSDGYRARGGQIHKGNRFMSRLTRKLCRDDFYVETKGSKVGGCGCSRDRR